MPAKKSSTKSTKETKPAAFREPMPLETSGNKRRWNGKVAWSLIALIILISLTVGYYFFMQYQKAQQLMKNPTLARQVEAQMIISKVGKLLTLPKSESPTIATVTDITKLKDQPFFAHGQNGFKVLIYMKAQKAILYDPVNDKIVEVGPINITHSASITPPVTSPSVSPRVAIYNGTLTNGAAGALEKQLKGQVANINVVTTDTAQKHDYQKTLVIDLTGKQSALTAALAKQANGQVASFPQGETKPDADILIIIGK